MQIVKNTTILYEPKYQPSRILYTTNSFNIILN